MKKEHKLSAFLVSDAECWHNENRDAHIVDFFHNGVWCVLKKNVKYLKSNATTGVRDHIKKTAIKPCVLCDYITVDTLEYDTHGWDEYDQYDKKEYLGILPSEDYILHRLKISIGFSTKQRQLFIKYIDDNQPKDIIKRAKYYKEIAAIFEDLDRITHDYVTVQFCLHHSDEEVINKVKDIILDKHCGEGTHIHLKKSIFTINRLIPNFYTRDDIQITITDSKPLIDAIEHDAYPNKIKY